MTKRTDAQQNSIDEMADSTVGPRISIDHVLLGSLLHLAFNDPQRLVKPDAETLKMLDLVHEHTYHQFMGIRAQLDENGTTHDR